MIIQLDLVQRRLLPLKGELQSARRPPVHLVRSVCPTQIPCPHKRSWQETILRASQSPVKLHGAIHHALGHVGHHGLDQAQQLPGVMVRIAQPVHSVSCLPHQKPRLVNFSSAFSNLLHNASHLCQLLTKGCAAGRTPTHVAKGTLSLSDHSHAVVYAPGAQPQLGDLEAAALSPKHVADRHPDILEQNLHVALGAVVIPKGLHGTYQRDPRRVGWHQDLRLRAVCCCVLGPCPSHQDHNLAVDVPCPCDPMLPTIDDKFVAIASYACPDIGSITAGNSWLCHRVSGPDLCIQQRLQPFLLLLFCAKSCQDLHVARVGTGTVARLSGEFRVVGSAHDLTTVGILQIRETAPSSARQLGGVHWQEEVPQPSRLGFLPQLEDDGRLPPMTWAFGSDCLHLLNVQ
mmetsp:Transcript_136603/g.323599  ORF Transcript_136603/g.323599 Transcript_136603/m.323599 type:complete len:402 (+) Transcript_136603:165-1370(+)